MKKAILLIALFLILTGCQKSDQNTKVTELEKKVTELEQEKNSLEKKLETQNANQTSSKKEFNFEKEEPLPAETIQSFPGDGYKKTLKNGLEVNVIVTDKEKFEAELRFDNFEISGNPYAFRGSEYQTFTFEDVNSEWFQFSFVPLSDDEIYFKDSSGHEGIPKLYIAKGGILVNLREVLKGVLVDKFPNERFPQLNATFYPSFIRVEEENYCCDILYDTNNPEREKSRKVFFLDRKTYNVLKEDTVPRK